MPGHVDKISHEPSNQVLVFIIQESLHQHRSLPMPLSGDLACPALHSTVPFPYNSVHIPSRWSIPVRIHQIHKWRVGGSIAQPPVLQVRFQNPGAEFCSDRNVPSLERKKSAVDE